MGGGLVQLAAYGRQDLYLTSNPQITFFKMVYKRHTNFSVESIPQKFNVIPNFGERVSITIGNLGDLISKMYLFVVLPNIPKFNDDSYGVFAWTEKIGYALIKRVELEINGQLIERQYGDWMNIWSELTITDNRRGHNKMIGNVKELTQFTNGKESSSLYVPLEFWFCKNYNMALPLISLKYSKVKIHVEFNRAKDCYIVGPTHYINVDDPIVHFEKYEYISQTVNNVVSNGIFIDFDSKNRRLYYIKINNEILNTPDNPVFDYSIIGQKSNAFTIPSKLSLGNQEIKLNIKLPTEVSLTRAFIYVDYIYLDTQERLKFDESNHEYLIETLQFNSEKTIISNFYEAKLSFNHPTKELFWQIQYNYIKNGNINDKFNYTNSFDKSKGVNNVISATILLGGNEAFKEKEGKYYNWVQPYYHHTNSPSEGINIYNYGFNPQKFQPSGSINFSRIDDIKIKMVLDRNFSYNNPGTLRTYSMAYNVLRIIDGIGGLAFSE
jgi:hypothetical protein